MDPRRLHHEAIVCDGHTDVPTRLFFHPAPLARRTPEAHVDLPSLVDGGVDVPVFALFVPAPLSPEEGWEHVRDLYRVTREHLADPGVEGRLEIADSVEAIRRTVGRGAVAVVLGLENGRPLLVPGALEEAARMGVRYVTPTHVESHEWCDASTDAPRHGGLSEEGVHLVREMNRLGILVDVSHVSDDAVGHCLEVSATPILASHSSARSLTDHPRNLPDELVREIARAGGLVMANSYPAFVDAEAAAENRGRTLKVKALGDGLAEHGRGYLKEFEAKRHEVIAGHPLPPVPLSTFVDHVVHLVELAGEEHVGIGTDFDGIHDTLVGLADASELPNLTAALLERGIDPAGVTRILGENFLDLLSEAERRSG